MQQRIRSHNTDDMMKKLHGIKVKEKLETVKGAKEHHKRQNPTAFKGYPGLTHTAKQICEYITKCKIYSESIA